MAVHEGKLQSPYYEYVRDGVKIYELRVNDEKRQRMNEGDIWMFSHSDDQSLPKYKARILEKKTYDSFESAIEDTGHNQLLPDVDSVENSIKIYNGFGNGSYEREAKIYGVVRFKLEVIFKI